MSVMDSNKIKQLLPHREPFLFVDRVLSINNDKAVGIKNVSNNESFFRGHFPQKAIMPGVIMVEALAQLSGILTYHRLDITHPNFGSDLFFFAGIDNVRFKRMVEPGDQLKLETEYVRQRKALWKYKGMVTVDGELACQAELLIASNAKNHSDE